MAISGDAQLAKLLEAANVDKDVSAVIDLVDGVLAAAEGSTREDWIDLICPSPDDELRAELLALRDERKTLFKMAKDGFDSAHRLDALRKYLAAKGVDGFVVPRADEHQGENVPARAERLAWLTGFTGSAGAAVVLRDRAAVFVDGRYTIQVRQQVNRDLFEYRHLVEEPVVGWLHDNLKSGQKLAYDPWLHTVQQATHLRSACEAAGAELVAIDTNPIDAIWHAQPHLPLGPVRPHPMEYAGKSSFEKRTQIAEILSRVSCDSAILSAPDSIAWPCR